MPSSLDGPPGTLPEEQLLPALGHHPKVRAEAETAFLKRLLESLPYPVSYIDSDLVYRQCNAAAAATVGCTPGEIVGRSVAAVVGADSEVLDLLRQVLTSGEPHFGVVEFVAPSTSSASFYQASYLPDVDAEGRVIGVLTNVVDVTDLVRAERSLRESEDRLRRIARAGGVGFVEYNVAADKAYWSPEHYQLFGFEAGSQVDWQSWLDGVHPEDRERVEANAARLLERTAAEGTVRGHTDEYRYVRPDGTVVWIEADMAVDMVDGQPIMRGAVRDVTERMRTEEALRESEERNAFLLRLADALRPLADPAAVQKAASRLLGEHLGADRAAYFEIRGDDYVIERDWAPSVPHLSGRFPIADFGEPLLSTYRAGRMVVMNDVAEEPLSAEEREAFAAVRVAAQISIPLVKSGEFVGGLSVHSSAPRTWTKQEMRLLEETAERTWAAAEGAKSEAALRRAEQALRKSEENFSSILRNSRDVLYRVDLHTGRYDYISPSVESMTGFAPGELMSMDRDASLELVHPEDLAELEEAIRMTIEAGLGAAEYRQRTKGGEYRWLSNYMVLARDEGGAPLYRIGNIRDVTDERQAETTLREHEAERVAQQERARLARNLHDSVTQSLFAATLKAEALSLAAGEEAPSIRTVAEELGRLNRGALAQMRTMLLELRGDPVEEVPLHQLLRNLVEAAESHASVKISLNLGEDCRLPPDVHETVYRITQEALNNVTRHAKAQNAWVELDRAASHARLVIGDDGCGFEPDSVKPGHFGLKSMRERADDSGGRLALRSVQGEGTALTVEWRFGELARKGAPD